MPQVTGLLNLVPFVDPETALYLSSISSQRRSRALLPTQGLGGRHTSLSPNKHRPTNMSPTTDSEVALYLGSSPSQLGSGSSLAHSGNRWVICLSTFLETGLLTLFQQWILKQPCKLPPATFSHHPEAVLSIEGPSGRNAHLCS